MVYPEGNTCNGRQICGFKVRALVLPLLPRCGLTLPCPSQLGPFQPGVPVQPMVISYARNKRMDPCWVEPAGLPVHIVAGRLLLQFHNFMEARFVTNDIVRLLRPDARTCCVQVRYLPVMRPSEAEKKEPALFAARVQRAMADALGVPVTEHSFADTRLLFAARKLKLPLAPTVLEMDKVARLWGASYADCRDVLERFAAAGGACCTMRIAAACVTRRVSYALPLLAGPGATSLGASELLTALRLSTDEVPAEKAAALLATFAQSSGDRVTFRELVAGLAPLARTAKAMAPAGGDPVPFVERAVAEIRANHL